MKFAEMSQEVMIQRSQQVKFDLGLTPGRRILGEKLSPGRRYVMLFHIKGRDGIWLLFVKETRRFPVGFPAIKVPFCITICMLGNFACFFVVCGFFFFFF